MLKRLFCLLLASLLFTTPLAFSKDSIQDCQKTYEIIKQHLNSAGLPTHCNNALQEYKKNQSRCKTVELNPGTGSKYEDTLFEIADCFKKMNDLNQAQSVYKLGLSQPDWIIGKAGYCSAREALNHHLEWLKMKKSNNTPCVSKAEIMALLEEVKNTRKLDSLQNLRGERFSTHTVGEHGCLAPFASLATEFKKAEPLALSMEVIEPKGYGIEKKHWVLITGLKKFKNLLLGFSETSHDCYVLEYYEFNFNE